jgi:hypothetical protein
MLMETFFVIAEQYDAKTKKIIPNMWKRLVVFFVSECIILAKDNSGAEIPFERKTGIEWNAKFAESFYKITNKSMSVIFEKTLGRRNV